MAEGELKACLENSTKKSNNISRKACFRPQRGAIRLLNARGIKIYPGCKESIGGNIRQKREDQRGTGAARQGRRERDRDLSFLVRGFRWYRVKKKSPGKTSEKGERLRTGVLKKGKNYTAEGQVYNWRLQR